MQTVRIGIIGIGNMGTAHATCLSKNNINGMVLTALCDICEQRLDYCRENFPEVQVFSDYHALFKSGLVDAVLIAVPHRLHSKIAIEAFEAGLHVLTEKPADVSVSAARRLNEAAQKSGKIFGIMFNQRTNSLFCKARELVQSGALGALKRSVWVVTNWYRTQHYYDSGSWRATWSGEGGGVLLNQAPHNLDLWQWICGMPVSVTAFCDVAKYHHIEVEDDVTIFARYENGATGLFVTSTGEYPGTNRLEISGERGKLVLENGVLKWWDLAQSEAVFRFASEESSPTMECNYREFRQEIPETAHAGILQNFANAILNGEDLIAPGYDGIKELTLSNAAYLSEWNANTEIKLPFDENEFDTLLAQHAKASTQKNSQHSTANHHSSYHERWKVRW